MERADTPKSDRQGFVKFYTLIFLLKLELMCWFIYLKLNKAWKRKFYPVDSIPRKITENIEDET